MISDAAVLILGICACAVVFALHNDGWATTACLVGAFVVWLGTGANHD